ncbi:hypothetical protein ALI22I_19920 [Saccharothrix sp. ALI-22-I]|uniref:CU044_2847 family protein n=1 Tax=Saccharothrix sp. ALI-22-I TaxID=1933778 RepID=UPI00097BA9BA|nr:CU044_2847 family protein [Saccharothrix sp. ALI-22-I]ONI88157.1 hypothetical protein ALI22I_19920 [Saccharothrix sp. ALI-22-I]
MPVVAVPTEGEQPTIFVEVATVPTSKSDWEDDKVRGPAAEKAVAVARDLLGDGVELARSCAQRFTEGLKDLGRGVAPHEVELQLGITLDAELGAVLAKTKTSAQLQITLRWQLVEER